MAAGRLNKVLRHLHGTLVRHEAAGLPDGELLAAYARHRDEAAFAALVRRHGPMVLGVCRRVLRNAHDAEDAFQATFLVLVRKAATLRSPGLLANFLYGVAYRTAQEARRAAARRRAKEARVVPPTRTPDATWADLLPVLDQELERLPKKYRAVVVLCDLEGKSRKEAARHLGCPEGTVASRLATARALLAKRLTRHGAAVSGIALAVLLAEHAPPVVPTAVLCSTVKAAGLFAAGTAGVPARLAALTEGVLKSMLLSRLKPTVLILAGLLAGLIGTAGAILSCGALGAQEFQVAPYAEQGPDAGRDAPGKAGPANPREALKGTWVLQSVERDGRRLPVAPGSVQLVVTNRFLIWEEGGEDRAFVYRLDPEKRPVPIDLTPLAGAGQDKGKTILGICSAEGGELRICESDGARPAEFSAGPGSGFTLYRYRSNGAAGPVALGPNLRRAEQGDLAGVEGSLRREVQNNHPDSIRILEALTKGYLRLYRLNDALWSTGEWLKLRPADPQAHYWRARVYDLLPEGSWNNGSRENGTWESGSKVQNNAGWGNEAVVWNNPQAAAEYRRALEFDPELDAPRLRLAQYLLETSAPQEALSHFERLRRRHPGNPAVRLGLARCALALGRLEECRKLLDDLLADQPRDAAALAERGKLALQEGQAAEAENWLRRSLAIDPQDRLANYMLFQCLSRLGRPGEARRYRENFERIEADQSRLRDISRKTVDTPNDPAPWTEGGILLLHTNREKEGLAWLLRAVGLDPHYRPANRALADYYQRRGEQVQAEKYRALAH